MPAPPASVWPRWMKSRIRPPSGSRYARACSIVTISSTNPSTASPSIRSPISRLAFSLGSHKLVPPILSRVHTRFKTPYISIILFSLVAILILLPGLFAADVFKNLGALYTFGSLLAFMFAHASIISLRIRKPELPRPFKIGGNIRVKGHELPISALMGLAATTIIWIIILATQAYSRWVGFGWMAIGLIIYYFYRRRQASLTRNMASWRKLNNLDVRKRPT